MTPNRYQQVAHIYHQAAELEPDERAQFLDRVCADDPELRNEVEALIVSGEQAGDFLDQPVLEVAARQVASEKDLSCVGRRLGHYKVLSVIGAGGMGEVYLAQDTALGRKVALKVLPAHFTRDARRLSRFVREARAASTLNHPNILTIYEIGEAGGVHFIATEFVEGVTLRGRLADGRLELRAALEVTRQVAAALRAAHSAGVVHRDIKPENVMVRPDGLVKVLDFGLATMTELQPEMLDTRAPTLSLPEFFEFRWA